MEKARSQKNHKESVDTYVAIGELGLQFRKDLTPFEILQVSGGPQFRQLAAEITLH